MNIKQLPRVRDAEELVVEYDRTELRLRYGLALWRLQQARKFNASPEIIARESALVAESRRAWMMCC